MARPSADRNYSPSANQAESAESVESVESAQWAAFGFFGFFNFNSEFEFEFDFEATIGANQLARIEFHARRESCKPLNSNSRQQQEQQTQQESDSADNDKCLTIFDRILLANLLQSALSSSQLAARSSLFAVCSRVACVACVATPRIVRRSLALLARAVAARRAGSETRSHANQEVAGFGSERGEQEKAA